MTPPNGGGPVIDIEDARQARCVADAPHAPWTARSKRACLICVI